MKSVKSFEEFQNEGTVKTITPDTQRSADLILEAKRKYGVMKKTIKAIGIDDENANEYVETCYNIIMFLIRSKILKQGYASSGKGAHEAEVAYAKTLGFSESDITILDQLRYFRNGILYYGKRFDKEYAEKIIQFTKKIYKNLIY